MLIEMGSTGHRGLHSKSTSRFSSMLDEHDTPPKRPGIAEALSELHSLLEEYAPSWYTEEHHRKAESALHSGK